METKKFMKIFWIFFRIGVLLFFSFLLTFFISKELYFSYDFHPLKKQSEVYIPVFDGQKYNILGGFFKFDILKYDTILFNNAITVFEGDKNDVEHEVEVYVKNNNSENEKILKYGEPIVFLEGQKRTETILFLKNLEYRVNINMKPEVLENKIIGLNEELRGGVKFEIKLSKSSRYILFSFSFLLVIAFIKLIKEVCQFIFLGKKYFK